MGLGKTVAAVAITLSAPAAQAQDAAIALGRSTFAERCAVCHGDDGKGGGRMAELFRAPPADLTKLAERAAGKFPFAEVYRVLVEGMETPGHGDAAMPVWGDYFKTEALENRGVSEADAIHAAAGRALSVVYYLETIQE